MSITKSSSLNSMLWSILGRYLPAIIQIISTIVIARLVTPSEFGEVALITVFIQISNLLIASGFSEALIFKNKNSNALYSTVFFTNVVFAIVLYIILFVSSKSLASFYEIERLERLIKVVGLNIIVYSFTYIHRVLYIIQENFKTPAIIVLISAIIGSVVGISLAILNYGVWALVFQTLLINFLQLVLFWKISNWKPEFVFSKKELFSVLPYSSKILFNNIIQVTYDNIYTLVIGKVFSSKILGYYNRMQTLVFFTTTNFMYAIESVFYPMLCKKKNDLVHLKRSYELLFRLSTFIAFPILIVLISLGKPIILILLSAKWIGSLEILKLLSIAYLFIPITYINNSFLKILNKPEVLFYSGLVKKFIGVIILSITINYDITTVLYGIIFYSIIDAFISMLITHYILKINLGKQLFFLLNSIILNIILFLILTYVSSLFAGNFTQVSISILIGAIVYVFISFIFNLKESIIIKSIMSKV